MVVSLNPLKPLSVPRTVVSDTNSLIFHQINVIQISICFSIINLSLSVLCVVFLSKEIRTKREGDIEQWA